MSVSFYPTGPEEEDDFLSMFQTQCLYLENDRNMEQSEFVVTSMWVIFKAVIAVLPGLCTWWRCEFRKQAAAVFPLVCRLLQAAVPKFWHYCNFLNMNEQFTINSQTSMIRSSLRIDLLFANCCRSFSLWSCGSDDNRPYELWTHGFTLPKIS